MKCFRDSCTAGSTEQILWPCWCLAFHTNCFTYVHSIIIFSTNVSSPWNGIHHVLACILKWQKIVLHMASTFLVSSATVMIPVAMISDPIHHLIVFHHFHSIRWHEIDVLSNTIHSRISMAAGAWRLLNASVWRWECREMTGKGCWWDFNMFFAVWFHFS